MHELDIRYISRKSDLYWRICFLWLHELDIRYIS